MVKAGLGLVRHQDESQWNGLLYEVSGICILANRADNFFDLFAKVESMI